MDAFRAINLFVATKLNVYYDDADDGTKVYHHTLLTYDAYERVVTHVRSNKIVDAIKLLREVTAFDDLSVDVRKAEGRSTTAFADFLNKEGISFKAERVLGLAEAKSVVDWMSDNLKLL